MIETDAIERACTGLIHQFAYTNDLARWNLAADLLNEGGQFTRPSAPEQLLAGRSAILAAVRSRLPRLTRHVITNILVTVEEPVLARAKNLIQLYVAGEDERAPSPLVGDSHDCIILTHVGWRFSERRRRLAFQP